MKANIETLTKNVETFNTDVEKFNESGNNAAGTRARKALLEIAKLSQELRKQIQEKKNESKA